METHRIKALAEAMKTNITQLEEAVGVTKGRFIKMVQRNSEIKEEIVLLIQKRYPKVNTEWLLNGTGTMFIEPPKKDVKLLGKHVPLRLTADQYSEAFGDWEGLPMYNAPVTASFVETYRDDSIYKPQYYLHDPRFRDCDFGAIITGDSMHSEIRHGDFIACKEVTDTRFIVYGDIYYVIATNGLETCKYVNRDPEDRNNLLLIAKNDKISPSPLPKDMIHKLYKVRGIVRGY